MAAGPYILELPGNIVNRMLQIVTYLDILFAKRYNTLEKLRNEDIL